MTNREYGTIGVTASLGAEQDPDPVEEEMSVLEEKKRLVKVD